MKWELLQLGTAPCMSTICLPDVISHDLISQAFPPLCIHNLSVFASDQILEVGMTWERG